MNRNFLSLAARRRASDDRGIALIVTIALMGIVGVLLVVLVSVAIHENDASGRDRQRSSGVMTAEGQVDTLIAKIQSAPPATLPCTPPGPSTVPVGPDSMTITNTVKYYTAAGTEVSCPPTVEVAQASIKSTSKSTSIAGQAPAVRTVETLLDLTPVFSNSLSMAIFGNTGVSLANHANIYGQNGQPNADVYTNGSVACTNNQHYYGSIYAQGSVTMSNTCRVEVDVHAKTGFTSTNPGVAVNGKVLVSNGNISLGPASLGQQARALGTVTGNACATAGKCIAGQPVDPPPLQDFPKYYWPGPPAFPNETREAWETALGYTVQEFPQAGYPCGMYSAPGPLNGKVDYVGKWIYDNTGSTTKTVIYANCPGQPVTFQGISFNLGADLAIFARGGFNFSGNTTIKSTTTDRRLLYLIQPFGSPCTNPVGISLDNQVTVEATVDNLLYSPCSIVKANNSTVYGQIYGGGQVTINNLLTMYFSPLPVPGLNSAGMPVESYSAGILYKRETTP